MAAAGEVLEKKKLGNDAFGRKDYKVAVTAYSEAIALDANNCACYSNRSASYAELQLWEQAANDAQQCVELARKFDATFVGKGCYRLGVAESGRRQHAAAKDAFIAALEALPQTDHNLGQRVKELALAAGAAGQVDVCVDLARAFHQLPIDDILPGTLPLASTAALQASVHFTRAVAFKRRSSWAKALAEATKAACYDLHFDAFCMVAEMLKRLDPAAANVAIERVARFASSASEQKAVRALDQEGKYGAMLGRSEAFQPELVVFVHHFQQGRAQSEKLRACLGEPSEASFEKLDVATLTNLPWARSWPAQTRLDELLLGAIRTVSSECKHRAAPRLAEIALSTAAMRARFPDIDRKAEGMDLRKGSVASNDALKGMGCWAANALLAHLCTSTSADAAAAKPLLDAMQPLYTNSQHTTLGLEHIQLDGYTVGRPIAELWRRRDSASPVLYSFTTVMPGDNAAHGFSLVQVGRAYLVVQAYEYYYGLAAWLQSTLPFSGWLTGPQAMDFVARAMSAYVARQEWLAGACHRLAFRCPRPGKSLDTRIFFVCAEFAMSDFVQNLQACVRSAIPLVGGSV